MEPISKLKVASDVVALVRDAILTILLCYAVLEIGPQWITVMKMTRDSIGNGSAQIEKVEVPGLGSITFKQAIHLIENQAKEEIPGTGLKDKSVSPIASSLVSEAVKNDAASPFLESKAFWVYLGQRNGDHWESKHFDAENIPPEGSIMRAIGSVFIRDDLPKEVAPGDWKIGRVLGILQDGSTVHVIRAESLDGGPNIKQWWVYAKTSSN